jgi:hypothetical protein
MQIKQATDMDLMLHLLKTYSLIVVDNCMNVKGKARGYCLHQESRRAERMVRVTAS